MNRYQRTRHGIGAACVAAVLGSATSPLVAQSVDGAAVSAAAIARSAALGRAAQISNRLDRTERQQAASMINNIRNKLDACGEHGMLAVQPDPADTAGAAAPGAASVPSRPALNWNPLLDLAASEHAVAMARQQFFDHVDRQGRTVGHRVRSAGYQWRVVGENLAAGQQSVGEAVRGWLLSSSHCRILIDARFTEFGLARVDAANPLDPYRSYWALVVAQPTNAAAQN